MHVSQFSSSDAGAYQKKAAGHHHRHSHKASRSDEAAPAEAASVSRAKRSERGDDDQQKTGRGEGSRPARNPLVAAMMEAIKSLVPQTASSAPAAAPAATATTVTTVTTAAPTTPEASASTAVSATDTAAPASSAIVTSAPAASSAGGKDSISALKDAAYAFAHELFHALKAAGESTGVYAASSSNGYGASRGYGDVAQALQRLAQSLTANPAAVSARAPKAETTPTAPVGTAAASLRISMPPPPSDSVSAGASAAKIAMPPPPSDSLTTIKMSAPTELPPAPAPAFNVTVNISINFGSGSTAAGAQTESPLLSAFKKLMTALNPSGAGSAEGSAAPTEAKSPEQMLQAFLLKIASSLQGDTAQAGTALPAQGSLVNLTA